MRVLPEDPRRQRFDRLYAGHYAHVLAYCRRRGDPDAEGTVADVFWVAPGTVRIAVVTAGGPPGTKAFANERTGCPAR